jgi:hypothetical protein
MRKDLEIGKTILLKRTYLDRILCCLFLVALLFVGNNASAASTPILLSDTALTPIQGYIDFLPNNDSINPAALLNGEFDTQFLRYDNKQAIISKAGIWLRFRITNSSNDENFISALEIHISQILNSFIRTLKAPCKNNKPACCTPTSKKSGAFMTSLFQFRNR